MRWEMDREFISVSELQHWLGCGRSKTYEMVQSGEIPSYRIGRKIVINKQEAKEWLDEKRYRPGVN